VHTITKNARVPIGQIFDLINFFHFSIELSSSNQLPQFDEHTDNEFDNFFVGGQGPSNEIEVLLLIIGKMLPILIFIYLKGFFG
jgi:hypothetical protein